MTTVEDKVGWLELFRRDENGHVSTGVAAMQDATCLATWDGTDKGSLIQFLSRFNNANSVLVAAANKGWPGANPVEPPRPVEDFSVKFNHLKGVKPDLALTKDEATAFWNALQNQIADKTAFNKRVNLGVKPEYGNAQCATTTASVLEGAAINAGLTKVAELFSKVHRDKDEFALTHQIEIMLKRLGFLMYSKATHVAQRGAIGMMAGRYDFAGCKQHSGHVFSIYTDMGVGNKDIICDNGGWNHAYTETTESFFMPSSWIPAARDSKPAWTPLKSGSKGADVQTLQAELNTHYGAGLSVDGDFGPKTEAAVKAVEAKLGLTVDGIVDEILWNALKALPAPTPQPTADNAKKYITWYEANYQAVRNEVQRWFAGVYSPTATQNGCVAHVVSCLHLTSLPHPEYNQLAAINVDAFVSWALGNGWSKNTDIKAIKPGDICVSGADLSSLDHVYAFVSYKTPEIAMVLHNQAFGLAERALVKGSCGEFKFSLRMPGGDVKPDTNPVSRGGLASTKYVELKPEYTELWAGCVVTRESEARNVCARILANKSRYEIVSESSKVPWYVIAVIHNMESGCDFTTHLHNGDPLKARTVQVPAGRPKTGNPPFTWEFSATDALNYDGLASNTDWCIEKVLYLLEAYNGFGMRTGAGQNTTPPRRTAYLWAATNQYVKGKYTSDGRFNPEAVSQQIGAAALLKVLLG